MAKAVQKIKMLSSRNIAFHKLLLSQSNVRRVKAGISIEDLAEDIVRRKLLQSLTSMKTPSLIRSIERRLAEISTEEWSAVEWSDVQVDINPREYVLDYLAHSSPVQLYEPFTDSEGYLSSRPVYRDGQPVESREAAKRRDRLIEKLASLPPVPGALDQIVQRFGTDIVAEVTGRSRRVVRKRDQLIVENREASANLAETAAFMDDAKRILIFSDAGGTGRSYHAELSARNRRLCVHYLLEPGWKADAAIQGLGRTNRTNQAQPPLFRSIATDVKAEKRFLSTIARRLDTLGAITRGQRQTGGQDVTRVYRLQTNAGERVIGRKVSDSWVANVLAADASKLASDAAFTALMEGRTVLDLAEGLQLRRVRVMGRYRIELSGFNDTMHDRLRAYGLFSEIISWKLHMFVPTDEGGVEALTKVLEHYPIERIVEREAA